MSSEISSEVELNKYTQTRTGSFYARKELVHMTCCPTTLEAKSRPSQTGRRSNYGLNAGITLHIFEQSPLEGIHSVFLGCYLLVIFLLSHLSTAGQSLHKAETNVGLSASESYRNCPPI